MDYLLTVDSILKRFGDLLAVNNLSFDIRKGEIFALLGPNGAGKTTIVRMLMNIIKPDAGDIKYYLDCDDHTTNLNSSQIGYLPEERGLYQEIPIIKTLEFMGIIRGMNKTQARKSAEEWLDKLELLKRKNDKLNTLSKGNQQKIQFISAILHNPSFAILDEPFSGFDPINQETFLMIIRQLRENGTTILLSAHQMHLVEKIADRVLLLNEGRKIAYGAVDEIKREYSKASIVSIKVDGSPELSTLRHNDSADKIEVVNNNEIRIYLNRNKYLSKLLNDISSKYNIISVKTEQISLHDIFIDKVKQDEARTNE